MKNSIKIGISIMILWGAVNPLGILYADDDQLFGGKKD